MEYIEVKAKTVNDAITDASIQLGVTSDQLEVEVINEGSTGFLGLGSKPALIRARKKFSVEDCLKDFLGKVFDAMNMEVEILARYDEDNGVIDVEFKDRKSVG